MAAYCNITDINKYVPQSKFTSTTVPSQVDVEQYINDTCDTLNLSLGNLGYVVPVVTGPQALRQLRQVNAWGALGIAQDARLTAVAPDQAINKSLWTKRFESWLVDLANPKNPLELDAPRTGKEIIKPVGEQQADTTSLIGDPSNTFDYLNSPPFSMDQKL